MAHSEALYVQMEAVKGAGVDLKDVRAVRAVAVEKELEVLAAEVAANLSRPQFEGTREWGQLVADYEAWAHREQVEPAAEPNTGESDVNPEAVELSEGEESELGMGHQVGGIVPETEDEMAEEAESDVDDDEETEKASD